MSLYMKSKKKEDDCHHHPIEYNSGSLFSSISREERKQCN